MRKGKVLITGGTSGLGHELVKRFLQEGYDVYTTGRNQNNLLNLGDRIRFIKIDFADLSSVKASIQELLNTGISFDIVINNAGVLSPPAYTLTPNGLEYTFQVNFLAHLLIDDLILGKKDNGDPLTIATVTSPVFNFVKSDFKWPDGNAYSAIKSYSESKFYLLLIGEYLNKKYPEKPLSFIGFNPGTFSSGIYRMQNNWFHGMYHIASPFMRNPSKVAGLLKEILLEQEIHNGAVYRNRNNFKVLEHADSKVIDDFMIMCSGKLELL